MGMGCLGVVCVNLCIECLLGIHIGPGMAVDCGFTK